MDTPPTSDSMGDEQPVERPVGDTPARLVRVLARSEHLIEDYSIDSESVVVRLSIVTSTQRMIIRVNWGDGTDDLLRRTNLTLEREYNLEHAYSAPPDGHGFHHTITMFAQSADGAIDFRSEDVSLEPLFNLKLYSLAVRLDGPCDPYPEQHSEFDITQILLDGAPPRKWRWKPSNFAFGDAYWEALPGSEAEARSTAGAPIRARLHFVETDPVFNDFYYGSQEVTFRDRADLVEDTIGGGGCRIKLQYYRSARLYVPLAYAEPEVLPT